MTQKLQTKTLTLIVALLMALGLTGISSVAVHAESIDHSVKCGVNFNLDGNGTCATTKESCEKNGGSKSECEAIGKGDLESTIGTVVNILSVLVGVVAVIMIIIGGFKYVTSGGDSNNVASAKNTIIYAIVGLIIAALAQVIARFVVGSVT